MKTITKTSNFGRFSYTATAIIGDEVNDETSNLAAEGMLSVCFRAGGSDAEKALVAAKYMEKDGKRAEVAYSEEAARLLETTMNAKLKKITDEKGFPEMSVTFTGEYEFGTSEVSRKMAEKVLALYDAAPEAKQMAFALAYGFEMEDSDDVKIAAIHKFNSGLREPRKAKA